MKLFDRKRRTLPERGEVEQAAFANQDEKNAIYEKCVVCGRQTDVLKSTHITLRKTFYPGVGQLCEDCCFELYHTCDLRTLPMFN